MVPFAEGSTVLGEKDGGEPFPGETGTTPSWCGGRGGRWPSLVHPCPGTTCYLWEKAGRPRARRRLAVLRGREEGAEALSPGFTLGALCALPKRAMRTPFSAVALGKVWSGVSKVMLKVSQLIGCRCNGVRGENQVDGDIIGGEKKCAWKV